MFKQEKTFLYKDVYYNYEELKGLKIKYPQFCLEGEVINIENGRIEDILYLERFYNDAIQESNVILTNNTIPSQTKYEVNNKLIRDNNKEIIKTLYKKIEDGTITLEDINYYWELKQPLSLQIKHSYKMKEFIKVSTYEEKSQLLKNFSLIDKGRILELIDLTSFDVQVVKDRKVMMEKLEFEDSEIFRRFMKKLNDEEIVYRLQKQNKRDVVFVLNPFIFTKNSQRELSIELFEMFPKSFKIFLPIDVYTYFKLKHEFEFTKINIENYY
jgi:hypothetical protein